MANVNLDPNQRGATMEVVKTPSNVIPFHSRGKAGLKLEELLDGQTEGQCQGTGQQGKLKRSTAVPDRWLIECNTCHTNLIPTFST